MLKLDIMDVSLLTKASFHVYPKFWFNLFMASFIVDKYDMRQVAAPGKPLTTGKNLKELMLTLNLGHNHIYRLLHFKVVKRLGPMSGLSCLMDTNSSF